jgi:hypothetical protein
MTYDEGVVRLQVNEYPGQQRVLQKLPPRRDVRQRLAAVVAWHGLGVGIALLSPHTSAV